MIFASTKFNINVAYNISIHKKNPKSSNSISLSLFLGHLARHMLIHLNQKSLICHQCGKGFNIFSNLNAHLRRHAGYKPHVCEVCKASFIDRTRLRLHMRTHTGERPFGCTICDKRFSDRYYMKIHMRLHVSLFFSFDLRDLHTSVSTK